MNTSANSNQSSSSTGSQTTPRKTARKSTGSSSVALSSQTTAPRTTARKSTGTRKTIPVDNNAIPDSSASSSPTASPRTARKSTGTSKTIPVDNSATPDSTTGTLNSQTASPRKGRRSTGTRPIAPANSSTSVKRTTRSSNSTSVPMPSQSAPSRPSDLSQPGCSWQGTASSNNISVSKRSTKRKNSQGSSDEELSALNLDNLVSKCVKYFLVADQKKYAIKKQDILKHVFEHQDAKLYQTVMQKASLILDKTFGLEILEIANNRKNEYLLINIIHRDLGTRDFAEHLPSELQKQGLVFYLLTLIFMNENVILEDQLWKALEPLGIDINSRIPHAIFGDVKKYITVELVKQMYLEYKCISKDPVQHEITWGQRAKQEVGKEDLLEFACKVMGDTRPQDWQYQYNDAMSKDPPDPPEE